MTATRHRRPVTSDHCVSLHLVLDLMRPHTTSDVDAFFFFFPPSHPRGDRSFEACINIAAAARLYTYSSVKRKKKKGPRSSVARQQHSTHATTERRVLCDSLRLTDRSWLVDASLVIVTPPHGSSQQPEGRRPVPVFNEESLTVAAMTAERWAEAPPSVPPY